MLSEHVRHLIDRQTSQAVMTLGQTVRELVRRGVDPAVLLAAVQRECRLALRDARERS